MAKYKYDLSKSGDLEKFKDRLTTLVTIVKKREFKEFIAKKCLDEIQDIQSYSLSSYQADDTDIHQYRNNHKAEIGSNSVTIFNDTVLEQGDMWWVSDETKEHYPNGISIAKLVEYGTGIRGTANDEDDWQVDVNGHGAKGWVYNNPNTGKPTWTNGIEGRFIYQKLLDRVKEKMGSWIDEYLKKEGL